jgi:hypothetical protein
MVKGETVMPVPGGEITTSEILVPVAEEVEDIKDFDAAIESNEETVPWEEVKNDLPELS